MVCLVCRGWFFFINGQSLVENVFLSYDFLENSITMSNKVVGASFEISTRSNCAIIGCNLSKKHKLTLRKAQNGESSYVDHKFLFNFYQELPTCIKPWTQTSSQKSCLVGWCMYCVTLRIRDIKNLTSVLLNTPWKYILCLYFTSLVKVVPPSFHYSFGIYLYFFLLYILLSQN